MTREMKIRFIRRVLKKLETMNDCTIDLLFGVLNNVKI